MYRVMIVDDEPIIRRGIHNSIPWEKYDMTVVGEAANGQEALDLADQLAPDVVIADICMPEIDGLEMSERLLVKYPGTKIIILTGYEEFEYAQRACKLGITDYVLKPTDTEELLLILEKAKKSIDSDRNSRIKMEELEHELQESMPIIRENYLIRLISGIYTLKEISKGRKILNINDHSGIFQVAILDYNSTESGSDFIGHIEMLHFAVKNICREIVDQESLGWTFYNERGQITLLFYFNDSITKPVNLAMEAVDKIQKRVNALLKSSFTVGVGRAYEHIKDIKRSYEEAKESLEYRFIMGDNSIIFIDDMQDGGSRSVCDDLVRIEKEIVSCINRNNEDIALTLIDCYFEKVKKQRSITPLWLKAKCYELAGNILMSFSNLGFEKSGASKYLDELYSEIYKSSSINRVIDLMKHFTHEILEIVAVSRNTRIRKVIEMGKEYIQKHFNEDISVTEVAEHLYVTPNYLSRIFKKETGEGCAEYINQVRMEKAKALLKNTLYLAYEIAEMVGFRDANYFSLAFKKYTGMSPTEYRDSILGEAPAS